MKDDTTPRDRVIRNWLIRHGDIENADHWAKQLGVKLLEGRKLNAAESSALASILLGYAKRGEAAKLFNKGKMPDPRNRFIDDYDLYEMVEKHKAEDKTRDDALRLAGEELGYPDGGDNDLLGTATTRYDSVVKKLKKMSTELERLHQGLALGGRVEELKELFEELDRLNAPRP
jgi:hypothetical protein